MSLSEIQTRLRAPKGQTNSFAGFKYRSCEDILEAVKPLLAEYGMAILLNDSVEAIGERIYVKATATLVSEKQTIASVSAYARESEVKKGMDDSQLTGTASSYARKYALNGLFAIDDAKDADTDEFSKPPVSAGKRNRFIKAINEAINSADTLKAQEVADELKEEDLESPNAKAYIINQYVESEHNGEKRMEIFFSLVKGNLKYATGEQSEK